MFMDFCGLEKKASEIKVCVCVFSLSVVSDSLRPHGLNFPLWSLSMEFSRQE